MSRKRKPQLHADIHIDLNEASQLDWQEFLALANIECEKAFVRLASDAPMPIQVDEVNGVQFPAYSTIGSGLKVQAELEGLGYRVLRDAPTKSGHWLVEVVREGGEGEIIPPETAVGYCSAMCWGALYERLQPSFQPALARG